MSNQLLNFFTADSIKALHSQNWAPERPNVNKRLCYCRGTARRATSVEILWPFLTELLTTSSTNADPCEHTYQLKSCKMPHNMFDGLHVKTSASGELPSRSFKVTASIWYAIYYFLLVFHCKCMPILHRFRDINTCRKLRRHVTLPTPTWGQFIIITRLTVLASSRA